MACDTKQPQREIKEAAFVCWRLLQKEQNTERIVLKLSDLDHMTKLGHLFPGFGLEAKIEASASGQFGFFSLTNVKKIDLCVSLAVNQRLPNIFIYLKRVKTSDGGLRKKTLSGKSDDGSSLAIHCS